MKTAQSHTVLDNQSRQVHYDSDPNVCPVCHMRIIPFHVLPHAFDYYDEFQDDSMAAQYIQFLFRCNSNACGSLFVSRYSLAIGGMYYLDCSFPQNPVYMDPNPEIDAISPSFRKIYNEALAAESYGLGEIAGGGFRKALEFLIKDYCISKDSAETENIKKMFLGNVISSKLDNSKIKECARRAVWLGNDEVHYVRTWDGHDITDLKNLIKITLTWIVHEIETDKYLAAMPQGGPVATP